MPNVMLNNKNIIEVAYATPQQQILREVQVVFPCTLRHAIEQSAILKEYPEINLSINRVGVFGKIKSLDDYLNEGDRIEIYSPLLIDPKEKRRMRAAANK